MYGLCSPLRKSIILSRKSTVKEVCTQPISIYQMEGYKIWNLKSIVFRLASIVIFTLLSLKILQMSFFFTFSVCCGVLLEAASLTSLLSPTLMSRCCSCDSICTCQHSHVPEPASLPIVMSKSGWSHTVLAPFLVHEAVSKRALYSHIGAPEVYCNVYDLGAPIFFYYFSKCDFFCYIGTCTKKSANTVWMVYVFITQLVHDCLPSTWLYDTDKTLINLAKFIRKAY